MRKINTSTPSFDYKVHPSRGELDSPLSKLKEFWGSKSLYPYWEIPKNRLLIQRAKELRKSGNLSEVLFWKVVKDKKKLGFDIDRQVIVGNYIVDFFIPELGLVFEIDGSSHDSKIEYDKERDVYMESLYLQVIRIPDVDVKKNIEKVYNYVLQTVNERKKYLNSLSCRLK